MTGEHAVAAPQTTTDKPVYSQNGATRAEVWITTTSMKQDKRMGPGSTSGNQTWLQRSIVHQISLLDERYNASDVTHNASDVHTMHQRQI